jgi:soluble lytic murein transglycosylase-like protein
MQVLPGTRHYVQWQLIGRKIPKSTTGNIQIGVVYLRHLLRQYSWNRSRALAAWYQGPNSLRRHGRLAVTRQFVKNVLALTRRNV